MLEYLSYTLNGILLVALGWILVRSVRRMTGFQVNGRRCHGNDRVVTREVRVPLERGAEVNLKPGDLLKYTPRTSQVSMGTPVYRVYSEAYKNGLPVYIPSRLVEDHESLTLWHLKAVSQFLQILNVEVPKTRNRKFLPTYPSSCRALERSLRLISEATATGSQTTLTPRRNLVTPGPLDGSPEETVVAQLPSEPEPSPRTRYERLEEDFV